jgi:hypothetical protein
MRAGLTLAAVVMVVALAGCDGVGEAEPVTLEARPLDNGPVCEPDRCTVTRDSTGENLGEGTIDINGFCCVPTSGGRTTCYACGSGFSCASIPLTHPPLPPRVVLPVGPLPVLAR